MASPFDALFNTDAPAAPAPARRKITENGKCRACGAEVFWTGYGAEGGAFVEVVDCQVRRHQCHRVLPEDFDVLE